LGGGIALEELMEPSNEARVVVDRIFEQNWEELQTLLAQFVDGYPLEWIRPGLTYLVDDTREELKIERKENAGYTGKYA
jgi:hypothetical protein